MKLNILSRALFTISRHLFLSWARSIQSTLFHSFFFKIYFNIIPSLTHRSTKWSLSFRFPHKNPVFISLLIHTWHKLCPSHTLWCNLMNNIWWGVKIPKLFVVQFFFLSLTSAVLGSNTVLSTVFLSIFCLCSTLNVTEFQGGKSQCAYVSLFEKNSPSHTLYSVRWVDDCA